MRPSAPPWPECPQGRPVIPPPPYWPDTIPAAPSSGAIVPAEPSSGSVDVIPREVHERRVTELLECNNRLLEETRAQRRVLAKAQWEVECARELAFEMRQAARRLDSVWRSTCEN